MCLNKNYKGIIPLSEQYPLDFTIDCFLNEKISYKMRANFAKLLMTLHIEKDPLETITVPTLARVWSDIVDTSN